jgi:hypothetical protein
MAVSFSLSSHRRVFCRNLLLATSFVLLSACSSVPSDWSGMSTDEISQWQQVGFNAKTAQSWRSEGFDPAAAHSWTQANFELDDALEWHQQKFQAAEAQAWIKGGFDLDDAVEHRAKGLTPIGQ